MWWERVHRGVRESALGERVQTAECGFRLERERECMGENLEGAQGRKRKVHGEEYKDLTDRERLHGEEKLQRVNQKRKKLHWGEKAHTIGVKNFKILSNPIWSFQPVHRKSANIGQYRLVRPIL